MTTISINIKDILNNTTVSEVSFTLKNAVFTSESGALKVGDTKTAPLTAGIGTVTLSAGTYEVKAGSKKFQIGVTGSGTATLLSLVDLTTPTPIQKGVPSGGTTGQVLSKTSNTDFDTSWLTVVLTDNNFTNALKAAYDSAVTWISTNGTNLLNHIASTANPHSVTKAQVGLGSVDNTSDLGKPVSTATQTALNLKQNTITNSDSITQGSTNLFLTGAERTKLTNTTNTNTGDQTSIAGISGTTAQFNTALSDGDFATLGGSETLTNKTLTDPVLNAGGVTGRILISMVQTSLGSNYNATAGTGEEEVTGLRVTLPILASGTYQIKITLKGYLGTVTGNNNIRIRLGTSTTYLSNTLLDNGYVGGAKTIESYLGTVIVTANLSAQNYVVIGFANDANRNGASFSASGTRTNVLVEIFK